MKPNLLPSRLPKMAFALALLFPGLAHAQLEWRISVKLFTNSVGALPPLPVNNWNFASGRTLDQYLSDDVAWVNSILDATGRGYRFRLTEIVQVDGATTPLPASVSSWYNLDVSAAAQDDLDSKVKQNSTTKTTFAFRDDTINFYMSGSSAGPNGGYCAGPTESQDVILFAPSSFRDGLIHEAGHYFSLQHTFNTGGSCDSMNTTPLSLGDDGIADTAQDYPCGTRDQLSQGLYSGRNYANLNSAEQAWVNTAWLNIMSYHQQNNGGFGTILTDDQLDAMTDISNNARHNVATGLTRFVSTTGNDSSGDGSSTSQYRTMFKGIMVADAGDIVLLRAGNYNEQRTINKPVTLRATRGPATIGRP